MFEDDMLFIYSCICFCVLQAGSGTMFEDDMLFIYSCICFCVLQAGSGTMFEDDMLFIYSCICFCVLQAGSGTMFEDDMLTGRRFPLATGLMPTHNFGFGFMPHDHMSLAGKMSCLMPRASYASGRSGGAVFCLLSCLMPHMPLAGQVALSSVVLPHASYASSRSGGAVFCLDH